jgi:hypothetical protein
MAGVSAVSVTRARVTDDLGWKRCTPYSDLDFFIAPFRRPAQQPDNATFAYQQANRGYIRRTQADPEEAGCYRRALELSLNAYTNLILSPLRV